MANATCSVDECERPVKARGWCNMHYQRWQRNGHLDAYVPIPAAERFWAKVDKSGDCWVWTGATSHGYGHFGITRTEIEYTHRWAYRELVDPNLSDDLFIDHICHNRRCCRPDHLRPATRKQNAENRATLQTNNTSGYQGVTWDKSCKKWIASVHHCGKRYYLGAFDSPEEAAVVAKMKRNELFSHNDADRRAS